MPILKSNQYTIIIGEGTYKAISTFLAKNNYSSCFILCDENTLHKCLPLLITNCPELSSAHIIEIENGEESKSLDFCTHIWQTLTENKADKNTLILNLGGGVVSDLGGFCASVYKRGIDFINVPTSLLAMADASVGGKTGIDFNNLKNIIGTFAQPKAVFINPVFLNTLTKRHYQNGLAEIYKIALVSDKNLWEQLKIPPLKQNRQQLITKSVEGKNKIVLKDPFDKGKRKILNFGHTIGHALEALLLGSESELLHGEAITIGMIMETHIAFQKKMIRKNEFSEIITLLRSTFQPKDIPSVSFAAIMELIKNDKKTSKNEMLFSLITKIGTCKFDVVVNGSQVKKAVDYYNSLFK